LQGNPLTVTVTAKRRQLNFDSTSKKTKIDEINKEFSERIQKTPKPLRPQAYDYWLLFIIQWLVVG